MKNKLWGHNGSFESLYMTPIRNSYSNNKNYVTKFCLPTVYFGLTVDTISPASMDAKSAIAYSGKLGNIIPTTSFFSSLKCVCNRTASVAQASRN